MKQEILERIEQGTLADPLLLCIFFFLFVFLVIKLSKAGSSKHNSPPSPSKLPLIGNLHQLGDLPHRTLSALSQKYGPMMLLHFGSVPTLVVSSADVVRDVLKTHDSVFSSRPRLLFPNRLFYGKDMAFAPYGEYWRQLRKVAVLQLLSVKKVQSFGYVREQEVGLMMESIYASPSSVNLRAILISLSNDVVCRVALGRKCINGEGEGRRRSLKAIMDELAFLTGVPNVGDFIPSLAWVNHFNGLNARVEKNFKELDSIFDEIVEEHIEKRRGGDAGQAQQEEDFVDIMLRIAEDKTLGIQLERDNIKAVIMDMFVAGTDTSAIFMEWVMSELMMNPVVMEEVQKEVRSIAKGRKILTEPDTKEMHYLRLVVKETMRMHPPAPLLVPRQNTEKVQVQGYDIPLNTTVIINAYAIGRDPKLWDEPQVFRPKRFSGDSVSATVDFKGQDFQFIPFGAGRRGCPGIFFATSVIELALANLLNSFDWELPNGIRTEDFDMQECFGLTVSRKNDLILCAKPHEFYSQVE